MNPPSCTHCGEFLPHYCAPVVTITRQRFTGRRITSITDHGRTTRDG